MVICTSCDTDTYPSSCHDNHHNDHCSFSIKDYRDGYQKYCVKPEKTIIITPDTTISEYNNTPSYSYNYVHGYGSPPNPPAYNPYS